MNASAIARLRDFVAAREDPLIVLLDARLPSERPGGELSNPYFPVLYAPRAEVLRDVMPYARLVGTRHAIIVDVREEDALAVARAMRSADVDADALENGLAGWQEALVEESCQTRGGIQIVTLARIAGGPRSYLLIEGGEAFVVNRSGSEECFLAEFERHHCSPVAAIDPDRVEWSFTEPD
jgi:hypothetical protein